MTTADVQINPNRLLEDFNELTEIGATAAGGVNRLALSNEDLEARAWLADRFIDAGLVVRDDDAGNLSGVLPSTLPGARTLLLGCHLDSVPDGGRYDSSVGAVAALECARAISEARIELPFHLEVIDFTDEEGCWQSLFGSRALTGTLTETYTSDKNADFGPFRAALFRAGIRPSDIHKARRAPQTLMGYLELHIEQGHRLDQSGVDIGIVTDIVGRTTYDLTFYGEASHSGTTAPEQRRDALLGAAAYICAAHQLAREEFPAGTFNCGDLQVLPGAYNIIPAEARLTMECRHADKDRLADMETALIRLAQELVAAHNLSVNVKRVIHMPTAHMAEPFVEAIANACRRLDVSCMPLVSYAGHNAQILCDFTATGMIFIPSVGGISHSPKELTEWRHVVIGTEVLLSSILQLATSTTPSSCTSE
jgi:beta-ureidopropionase / N-carbamoyl-L-amino-acid hydrolase